jgi:hypothetical protein
MDVGFEQVPGCCTGGPFGPRQITGACAPAAAARPGARPARIDSGFLHLLATPEERERLLGVLNR